jgi:hypothetical protein
MMLEQNDEWSLQRRYMPFEELQSLSENQSARLSAVINLPGTQPLENYTSYTKPGDTILL